MVSTPETVRIHYLRPPGRTQVFNQTLVARPPGCWITLLHRADLAEPMWIDARIALEPGAPIVWFTFDGAWHDIGRFHDAAGRFTGYYANILTPVAGLGTAEWRTTDLFLDVWLPPRPGAARLLDEDEFASACGAGLLDDMVASTARAEAASIMHECALGTWPPAVAREWTLERARDALTAPRHPDASGGVS